MRQLTFLGTGHGMPIASCSSSLLLEEGNTNILFDCSGGHEILCQFNKAKKDISTIKNIFITHYDSDHILGIVPLVRALTKILHKNKEKMRIFCSSEVKNAIDSLFLYTAKKYYENAKPFLEFVILKDRMNYKLGKWQITFFDTQSNKSPEFGCKIEFGDKKSLAFPGDEPVRENYKQLITNCDVLIHEAFCLDTDKDKFKPHEKNHGTVKEAAELATKINAKKLVFFHMEDTTLKTRKKKYLSEAKKYFKGEVFVPVDLDVYQF